MYIYSYTYVYIFIHIYIQFFVYIHIYRYTYLPTYEVFICQIWLIWMYAGIHFDRKGGCDHELNTISPAMRREASRCGVDIHILTIHMSGHTQVCQLMEEIRFKTFWSPHLSFFLQIDLLSDGDSVYSSKNLFEKFGTPVKTC